MKYAILCTKMRSPDILKQELKKWGANPALLPGLIVPKSSIMTTSEVAHVLGLGSGARMWVMWKTNSKTKAKRTLDALNSTVPIEMRTEGLLVLTYNLIEVDNDQVP